MHGHVEEEEEEATKVLIHQIDEKKYAIILHTRVVKCLLEYSVCLAFFLFVW